MGNVAIQFDQVLNETIEILEMGGHMRPQVDSSTDDSLSAGIVKPLVESRVVELERKGRVAHQEAYDSNINGKISMLYTNMSTHRHHELAYLVRPIDRVYSRHNSNTYISSSPDHLDHVYHPQLSIASALTPTSLPPSRPTTKYSILDPSRTIL